MHINRAVKLTENVTKAISENLKRFASLENFSLIFEK